MYFDDFKTHCCFHMVRNAIPTGTVVNVCYHIKNIPEDWSWNDCNEENCPLLK